MLNMVGDAYLADFSFRQQCIYTVRCTGFHQLLCASIYLYASRYEVFRRYLKQMLNRSSVIPDNAGEVINRTEAARVQH